jgi:hypothetical protein
MALKTRTSEEILPEDEVTNALIDKVDGDTAVEVPYNNYGERGYVDLVRSQNGETHVIELKSKPRSANQVIRQFQKMQSNFLEGTNYENICSNIEFKLIFTASYRNLEHLKQNKNMYRSLDVNICMADERGRVEAVWDTEGEIRDSLFSNLNGVRKEKDMFICQICGKEYQIESYYKEHVKGCFE